jgi:RNA 3'-terminal phosphate cyclase
MPASQAGRRGFDPRLPLQNQQVNGPQNLHSARRVALLWGPEALSVEESRNSAEPGNIVMIEIGSSDLTEIFSAFGQVALAAEKVASITARARVSCLSGSGR